MYPKTIKPHATKRTKNLDTLTLENLYNYAEQARITIIETPLNTTHSGYYDHATHTILLDNMLNDRQNAVHSLTNSSMPNMNTQDTIQKTKIRHAKKQHSGS